jgi:hypothetical protein
MGNIFEVNVEGIVDNKYDIDIGLTTNDISIDIIKEEKNYEISIETITSTSLVSPNTGNRLIRTIEGGLYVPEIDIDLVSIYEEAKL